jgi:hypothetical protein
MRFLVRILTVILLFSMINSCRKKDEPVPDVDCRISKIYLNGNLSQVFTYNEFGKINKLTQYSFVYYTYLTSKITDELYFEYDEKKRLSKIQSRFSPNYNVIKFQYNDDKTISFEKGGYEVTAKGIIEFTEQNNIRVAKINRSDKTTQVIEYSYYPDGNLRGIKNNSSWNTSIDFLEFDNSKNPFFVQKNEFELLNLLNDNLFFFNYVSVNNPIKTSQSIERMSYVYNKYGFPKEMSVTGYWFPDTITYTYEYENCK